MQTIHCLFLTRDGFMCAITWAFWRCLLRMRVSQVGCWLCALLFLCRTSVAIERASHGGDGLNFERLLRSRLRRRVGCNGAVAACCAIGLHLVLPYYGACELLLS